MSFSSSLTEMLAFLAEADAVPSSEGFFADCTAAKRTIDPTKNTTMIEVRVITVDVSFPYVIPGAVPSTTLSL